MLTLNFVNFPPMFIPIFLIIIEWYLLMAWFWLVPLQVNLKFLMTFLIFWLVPFLKLCLLFQCVKNELVITYYFQMLQAE